jgi:hypothetical protein
MNKVRAGFHDATGEFIIADTRVETDSEADAT